MGVYYKTMEELNKYKCNKCGKIIYMQSQKKWMYSYCDEIGDITRLYLIIDNN